MKAKDAITRRDFLNGTRIAIGAGAAASLGGLWPQALGAPAPAIPGADYYPPAATGLRGSHPGSWETMHARVSGAHWRATGPSENYDLVIVGAGISGLAAAHLYLEAEPGARVLLLDNHDDFGGHAKRNEFNHASGTRIAYGGTESIDTPSSYDPVSLKVLKDVGVQTERFYNYFDQSLYEQLGLDVAIAFDASSFAERRVVKGYGSRPWAEFAAEAPMSDRARADLVRVFTEAKDYLPGMSQAEKRDYLSGISYLRFLKEHVGVDDQLLELYRRWGMSFWCVGMDEVPALAVQAYGDGGGIPGLQHTVERDGYRGDEPYIFHFPDGNASIARLLVRRLIPAALPGSTMEDSVLARLDYGRLDRPDNAVRIRLNSTAVQVQHTADAMGVEVTYVRDGVARSARGKHCVLACYNAAIPYLCPELPEAQREGLAYNVKIPLTYTKILVDNWRAFADQGIGYVFYTNDFYKQVELDYPVSMGGYEFGRSPNDPMVLHMCHVPHFQDIQGPEQWRAGRRALLETPFETFEHHVRDQLDQALGAAGFEPDRDIHAITVNRWAHGYAYSPDLLWEPHWPGDASKPWVIGRQPFGRISIANSDAGASADTNSAIVEAHRAIREVLAS
ncbi:MAG: NAD(P)-binding protein [Pseudomonadota bacterium]